MRLLVPLQLGFILAVFAIELPGHADPKIFLDSIESALDPKVPDKITVTEWYIEPAELDRLPAYDPASGAPPVTIADAIKIARPEVDKTLQPKSIVTLESIELLQIDRGNSGETVRSEFATQATGKWYYKITYSIQRPDPKFGTWTYPMPVYVLMDGTLSERRDRPQTKEEQDQDQQMGNQVEKAALDDAKKNEK